MDNTSINVTDVNAAIAINSGQFLIYGNKLATLQISDVELTKEIKLVPNPTTNYFTIDTPTSKVEVYSLTGQLVKSFKSNFNSESQFDISDLNRGIYLVKVKDNHRESTMKLIKQ
jgi:hypothetical protein